MLAVMSETETYPGADLGLPRSGRGSLASWGSRVGALFIDWGASMLVAMALFGVGVMREGGWKAWMTMAVFFVQKTLFTWLASGSFGQLVTRIAVVKVAGGTLGLWRSAVRTAMICLVIPAVVVGPHRRGLDDVLLDTVVVNRVDRRGA